MGTKAHDTDPCNDEREVAHAHFGEKCPEWLKSAVRDGAASAGVRVDEDEDDCGYDPFGEIERLEDEAEARIDRDAGTDRSEVLGYCDRLRRTNPDHCCSQCEPEQRIAKEEPQS